MEGLTCLMYLLWALHCGSIVTAREAPFRMNDAAHGTQILDDEFSTWMEEMGKEWSMQGAAVVVVRKNNESDDWITETKGYGVADRWGNAVDDETLFSIGSNSKLFTSLAVGMLVENTSIPLAWNSKVKDVVQRAVWGLQDKVAEENANILDILSHRTGLPPHDLSYSRGNSLESTLSKLRYLRPSIEFREGFQYNNQMYCLAAYIVSHLTKLPFADYVAQKIISPLGLESTTYNVTLAQESGKLAEGFVDTGEDAEKRAPRINTRLRPIPYWNREGGRDMIAGAGGVISNAKDLVIWLQTLLLLGRSPQTGEQVIPIAVVDRVSRGVTISSPVAQTPDLSPIVYGMGQWRYTYQGHELIEHTGGVIGQHSVIMRAPNDGIGIAILTNWDYGMIFMNIIKYRLLEKTLGLSAVDWNMRFQTFHELPPLKYRPVGHNSANKYTSAKTKSIPAHDLAGLYFNPGYGTLAFCVHPPPSAPHVPRQECAGRFPDELRPLVNNSETVLFAAWSKIWSSHVILQRDFGDRFIALPVYAFPAPFPAGHDFTHDEDDSRPFAVPVYGQWPAQFITVTDESRHTRVDGMAWNGVSGTAGLDIPGDGKESAEVWFDRVA